MQNSSLTTTSSDKPSFLRDGPCSASYMTPWATVLLLSFLYFLALTWFCTKGRRMCSPVADSMYPYQKRLKRLKSELGHLLVEDSSIEVLDHKLGEGNTGFVFRARVYPNSPARFKLKTDAAVKMSYPTLLKSINLLEEASRMSRLQHPNIVQIIAVSKLSFSALRPAIVMEWLAGGSLAAYFNIVRGLEDARDQPVVLLRDILRIMYDVASALQFIHECVDDIGRDCVHGDIAARNVLLTSTDLSTCRPKLGDFGVVDNRRPVAWLPPEILCAQEPNPKHRVESDVWMFGVFMWECLTVGATPHYHRSIPDIQRCIRLPDKGLPCPSICPVDVWSLVLDCVHTESHRRVRSTSGQEHLLTMTTVRSCNQNRSATLSNRLDSLCATYASSQMRLCAVPNISHCSCAQHRCANAQYY